MAEELVGKLGGGGVDGFPKDFDVPDLFVVVLRTGNCFVRNDLIMLFYLHDTFGLANCFGKNPSNDA